MTVLVCAGVIIFLTSHRLATFLVCAGFLAQNILANRIGALLSSDKARYVDAFRYALNTAIIFALTFVAGSPAHAWLQALPPIAGAPVYFVRTVPALSAQMALALSASVSVAWVSGEPLAALVPFAALSTAALLSTSITVFLNRTSERLFSALLRVEQEVSVREKVEYELRDVHAQLEQRVEERTLELSREVEERQRAEERAIEASRVKSQFLANMSHELRTPLNAVLGYTELISELDEDLAPQTREDLGKIHSSGMHLLSLIQDILDLSKIEAGRLELDFEMLDVAALMADIKTTAGPLAAKNNNKLSCACDPRIGLTRSDPFRIKQILLNLVSNACKFTHEGTINVCARRIEQPGLSILEFEVTDTGIGIAPETMERLFQPFIQADSSTTRNFGGTGLGLSISRRLAQMLGGDISVASVVGEGSTFRVQLKAEMSLQLLPSMAAELALAASVGHANRRRVAKASGG